MSTVSLSTFDDLAPKIAFDLARYIPGLSEYDCCAIIGNAGHECLGFTVMQEIHPIRGLGGLGWFQWTGPRRQSFEYWLSRAHLEPASYDGNFGFLLSELKGPYAYVVNHVKAAIDIRTKTDIFEKYYEAAGVPALASREAYALRALSLVHRGTVKAVTYAEPHIL